MSGPLKFATTCTRLPVSLACNDDISVYIEFMSILLCIPTTHCFTGRVTPKVVLAGREFGQANEGTPHTAAQGLQHRAAVQEDGREIRPQVIAGVLASERSGIDQVATLPAASPSHCHPLLLHSPAWPVPFTTGAHAVV